MIELASKIKNSRKICNEFYSRNISQLFSHYFSAFFIHFNISPNTITLLMLLIIFPISFLLLSSSNTYFIIGSFFLIFINILDASDGEVARYTKKTSESGVYLDYLFQYIVDLILFLVLIYKFYHEYRFISVLIFIYLSMYLIDSYSKRSFNAIIKKNISNNIYQNKNLLKTLLSITSSNTFFYHTFWIILLIKNTSFGILSLYILDSYFIYLASIQSIKTFYRFRLNYKILSNENM